MVKTIFISIIFLLLCDSVRSQITGHVFSEENRPLSEVNIHAKKGLLSTKTNIAGGFVITLTNIPDTLIFESLNYEPQFAVVWEPKQNVEVHLKVRSYEIEEVLIQTGYQDIAKGRTAGSFSHLDNDALNRSVSPDIISRLEGMVAGLQFNRLQTTDAPSTKPDLRVRGLSTIHGESSPLIILDNFPYEGNLNDINPNDVESVTILKDASAAAIWGARAGNGVIVVTSKHGKATSPFRIGFKANTTISQRPDLFYDRRFIPAHDAVELEKMLFDRGLYQKNDWTAFTPAVEILFALKEGTMDSMTANSRLEQLKAFDVRNDAFRYLYRPLTYMQYGLNAQGGTAKHRYYLSFGLDDNKELQVGDNNKRISTMARNEINLTPDLLLSNTLNFVQSRSTQNGIGLMDLAPIGMGGNPYVYMQLADQSGNPLPVVRNNRKAYTEQAIVNGLVDWEYRPLDELELADNTSDRKEIRINTALTYNIRDFLKIEGRYQYQNSWSTNRNHYSKESYYARHLINRFTQADGSRPVPLGGILDRGMSSFASNYGRLQLNFNKDISGTHFINGIAGVELREDVVKNQGNSRLYGYNDELLTHVTALDFNKAYPLRPNQSSRIENGNSSGSEITDRFLSYYANFGYSFQDKYLLNTSLRWDASNIYGVDFNQKGVPLWSVGTAWNMVKEPFLSNLQNWFSQLRLRATYGWNGNSFRTLSSLPTVRYGALNSITGQPQGNLVSVGNPDLSWEKVETINFGVDFNTVDKRFGGSIEWYRKNSSNLIGEDLLDPTKGFYSTGAGGFNVDNRRNYADLRTTGMDIELNMMPVRGQVTWQSTVLFSVSRNIVTSYYTKTNLPILNYLSTLPPVVEGNSKDQLYSVPWYGLDTEGNPTVLVDGELGIDYDSYFNNLGFEGYNKIGLAISPYFGAWRNGLSFRQFTVDANISWKAGHVFRRSTIEYSNLLGASKLNNMDFLNRWQSPGDEQKTNVPSMPNQANTYRDMVYASSDIVYEDASHVRLQDVSLSYRIPLSMAQKLKLADVRIFFYARNLGIIWKKTQHDIDPDVFSLFPQPKQFSFGFDLNF
ncbi:SusC/RagA family TonB-linked outer membrane protein [Sphingobacterium lumbrici]|uniref:SusC/RagA family TonB-linked outer membrane protein n=1 Tax=Sphingobacterium lumbrici TaxID=2559600 RepID=UPI001128974D|nr:SusC/RagA family TonB-linked outer membrane protein [Sphingobacterium lumbrici]